MWPLHMGHSLKAFAQPSQTHMWPQGKNTIVEGSVKQIRHSLSTVWRDGIQLISMYHVALTDMGQSLFNIAKYTVQNATNLFSSCTVRRWWWNSSCILLRVGSRHGWHTWALIWNVTKVLFNQSHVEQRQLRPIKLKHYITQPHHKI